MASMEAHDPVDNVALEDRQELRRTVERVLGVSRSATAETADTVDALGEAIVAGFLAARATWSTVRIELSAFAEAALRRATERPGDPLAALVALRLADLYLATACVLGDSGAILAFEAEFFSEVDRAFSRVSHSAGFLDDARQNLRERFFVRSGDRAPELASYAGRGSLRGWCRLACTHHTLNLKRSEARAPLLTDSLADGAAEKTPHEQAMLAQRDPELLYLQQRYLSDFRAAATDAAERLPASERMMLQHHYLENLSIDRIAAIYGIHRVTAARRVNKARDEWVSLTRAALGSRLRIEGGELLSVLRLLPTQFSMSLRRLFGSASATDCQNV